MRKIDLRNYTFEVLTPEGEINKVVYDVKRSIEGVVLATGPATVQRLSMADLLRNARVIQKIMNCKEDFVLLEEEEYKIIKDSFEAFRGFGQNDVELCKRIANGVKVEVEEKKTEAKP